MSFEGVTILHPQRQASIEGAELAEKSQSISMLIRQTASELGMYGYEPIETEDEDHILQDQNWRNTKNGELIHELMTMLLAAEQRHCSQSERIRKLERLTMQDELTGLFNRRGFNKIAVRELERAKRTGRGGILVTCDLNNFKPINDLHGHPVGDICLCKTGEVLRNAVRSCDAVARLGGDEFAVLLTDIDETDQAAQITCLTRLANCLTKMNIHSNGKKITFSASLGHAYYRPHDNFDDIMTEADKLLYIQKEINKPDSEV